MSETEAEVPVSCYFDLPRRHHRSTEGSEAVSPYSRPKRAKSRPPRPRLSANFRSQSDDTYLRLATPAFIVEEGISTHHSTLTRMPLRSYHSPHTEKDFAIPEGSRNSSTQSSVLIQKPWHETAARPWRSVASSSDAKRKSAERRSLKLSAALTRRPLVERSRSSQEVSACSRSTRHSRKSIDVPLSALQPLRPPSIQTQPSTPLSEHRITIEQSFEESLSQLPQASEIGLSLRQRSSVSPVHIFSAPIVALRRITGKRENESTRAEYHHESYKSTQATARDHLTNLRRHETAAGLQRVASMLHDLSKLDGKRQAASSKIASPNNQNGVMLPMKADFRKNPRSLKKLGSLDMSLRETGSQSSSLADYRINPTPYNTPEEQATYTVINQNGESEEFLKVDISVRGQTSYLPSEARRIHTPPLPSETSGGRTRGFFFDYNLPLERETHPETKAKSPRVNKSKAVALTIDSVARSPTQSMRAPYKVSRNGSKIKTGDWYDIQLAELDSSSSNESDIRCKSPAAHESTFCSFLAEQQRLRDEARLDHTIPEHLPNSPLCPRHPRYWRIIKKRGSQFRGCWMHGFGEFTAAEKARYSIQDYVKVT